MLQKAMNLYLSKTKTSFEEIIKVPVCNLFADKIFMLC